MKRPARTAALALALVAAGAGAAQEDVAADRPLVWHDEFDGPAGQAPDAGRWVHDVGTDWGNLQLEFDTDRTENACLDGQGNLVITAREEAYEGQPYTSARIKTKGLFARTYGRFETRARLPIGQGLWPAFWLLGANIDEVGWPGCGEIDVMEYRGHLPGTLVGSIHGPGHAGDDAISRVTRLAEGTFHDDFHVFAVEWEPGAITWYLDGEPYHRVTPADLPEGADDWVYDHPFFIILNVAVGGRWAGPPDGSTTFPQTLVVDYVRVYGPRP